jgi:hypothetical protein
MLWLCSDIGLFRITCVTCKNRLTSVKLSNNQTVKELLFFFYFLRYLQSASMKLSVNGLVACTLSGDAAQRQCSENKLHSAQDVSSMATRKTYCQRPYKCVKCGGNHMTSECQKSKETPAKCALCSGVHSANYKGCTIYRDLQNARCKLPNRNQQTPGKQIIPQNNINPTDSQRNIRPGTTYSRVP